MEIKAELKQPYTESERIDFVVKQNHNLGYLIEEQEDKLIALGYTTEELQQQEQERLAMLNMTGADVERAIYKVKGIDFDDILAMVKANPAIDEKALKIEFKANNFFRGNPYIEQVGALLGFTSKMLDKFFETKDYHYLTTCKLTINATPENATIVINSEITSEVTIPYGSVVDYIVSCDGYESKCGVFEITKDEVLEVVLDENTTDTTIDVSNEVEAEPTGDVNTDKN